MRNRRALRYTLDAADSGDVRFVVSPLSEVGLSLRARLAPARHPIHAPWLTSTSASWDRLDREALSALVVPPRETPDFLTPGPSRPRPTIDEELDALARMPVDAFHDDLARVHGYVPRALAASGRRGIDRMVTALRDYWDTCFAQHWARMRSVLDADVAYRGRTLTDVGLGAMLDDLGTNIAYADRVVEVSLRRMPGRTEPVGRAGVTCMPSLFTDRVSVPIGVGGGPFLLYPARGQAGAWSPAPGAPDGLRALLGAPTARLLSLLSSPGTTTGLALATGSSAPAVSHHLRVLHGAGLVSKARTGRSVEYRRTALGDALVAAASGVPGSPTR